MNNRLEPLNQFISRFYFYVGLGVVLVISAVMMNWFIWPQYERMTADGVLQYENMSDVLSQRQQYLVSLAAMKTAYEELDQRTVRSIDLALPTGYSDGLVYAEVERMLADTKFIVQSINVSTAAATDTAQPTGYQIVSVSVNVSASEATISYSDFKDLLHRIEQYPHLMDLESLIYTPGTAGYTLILKTYQRTPQL